MAKILFVWELGFGLGHSFPISQYAATLQDHDVIIALRNLRGAFNLLAHSAVKFIQAPIQQTTIIDPVESPQCFAHLLHNNGFSEEQHLNDHIHAWCTLYDLVKPDMVIFDHSPSALLAARNYTFTKVLIGSGFLCPPIQQPLGVFFPTKLQTKDHADIVNFEKILVKKINATLLNFTIDPLIKLSDIYQQADATLLTSLPDLDHFGDRKKEKYIGLPPMMTGESPQWPQAVGKKIFIYTHNFKELPFLLQTVIHSGCPILIYSSSIHESQFAQFKADNLVIASKALDLNLVSEQCDVAIVNGNYNTASQLALSGVPVLCIPIQRDQLIFSNTLNRTGASLTANPLDRTSIANALQFLFDNYAKFKGAADALKEQYAASPHSTHLFQTEISKLL